MDKLGIELKHSSRKRSHKGESDRDKNIKKSKLKDDNDLLFTRDPEDKDDKDPNHAQEVRQ